MKDNKNKILMIVGICAIIVILILGVLFGANFFAKDNSKDDDTNEVVDSKVNEKTEVNEEIEALLRMVPSYVRENIIYKDHLITIDSFNSTTLTITYNIYEELEKNYSDEIVASVSYEELDGEPNMDDYSDEEAYWKDYEKFCIDSGNLYRGYCYVRGETEAKGEGFDAYHASTIEKVYKKFYGDNFNYSNPEYIGAGGAGCFNEGEYYFCEVGGGYGPGGDYHYTTFVKSEEVDNQLYIYVKYLYVDEVCDDDYDNCIDYIYANEDKQNKLGEINYEDYETSSDLFEKYGDNAVTYKHTYKKNSDGNYYWYSVEPVK